MYAHDDLAVAATHHALRLGWDRSLAPSHRVFLYMPLMHSETLDDQEQCVALFATMHDEIEGPRKPAIASNLHFAKQHRDIVQRFGRFPHRNQILGRESTPQELAFLKEPGSSF